MSGEKKLKKYFVGLDIGTDSVGYCAMYDDYKLIKCGGEAMWGSIIFEAAQQSAERRTFRTARRRLNRRQHRIELLRELFAREIGKVDPQFFIRIKESGLFKEDKSTDTDYDFFNDGIIDGAKYFKKYPTIHHLIYELMTSEEEHDVRLVYTACAWLAAHRGHFLSEVSKENIENILDFEPIYTDFKNHFTDNGYDLPWITQAGDFEELLRQKCNITTKEKKFFSLLWNGKKPKTELNDVTPYDKALMIKLLCGGKAKAADLFGKSEYSEIPGISLGMADEDFYAVLAELEDDSEIILKLKALYDWAVLTDVLNDKSCISEAKIAVYEQHKQDLKQLKTFIKKYLPAKYDEVFRETSSSRKNYTAYSKHTKNTAQLKSANKEEFCEYLRKLLKDVHCESEDEAFYADMMERLSLNSFAPKQVDTNNRVIPYQLYWHELNEILKKASKYLEFLNDKDSDGITVKQKILSVFEFRIPYFVGPLTDKSEFAWMKRRSEEKGRIYPWNFEKIVDLDKSEQEFIDRMTNTCTYVPGENVLPKNSLLYTKFEVLNEINNIKINGAQITVAQKQKIYIELFGQFKKVTPKRLRDFVLSNGICEKSDVISGVDMEGSINSSLKAHIDFKNLLSQHKLNMEQVENYIIRCTYSEDKFRLRKWVDSEYADLSEKDRRYITTLNYKDFGRLSEKLLCGIEGTCKETGEMATVIDFLWSTNENLMQLLSDRYTFKEEIEKIKSEYYSEHKCSIEQELDEMYISNAVKRPILRAYAVLKEIKRVMGYEPQKVFVEMARGANEEQKNNRTKSRRNQIIEWYKQLKTEDTALLSNELEGKTDNELQSEALFLYFMQLGKCMYTGERIEINQLKTSMYNIDHIYPQCFVKDDSILNNKVLVLSSANGKESDIYPVPAQWRSEMSGYWSMLKKNGLITEEKYRRLTRTTPFSNDEKLGFINRQLVETRQSSKALAEIINRRFENTEVVYVKAGLVSEFRRKCDSIKCRAVNDLHHAKDAFLNAVVGNVYNERFTKRFNVSDEYSINFKAVFGRKLVRGDKLIWDGEASIAQVKKTLERNNIHYTRFAFCRKGGLFDQNPLKAGEGLIPRKKGMDPGKYGGYNKPTATFFALVKYATDKKSDVIIMAVDLMHKTKFEADEAFRVEYAKNTIEKLENKTVTKVEFPLGNRMLKVNTVFSLDGFNMALGSKSSGGAKIGLIPLVPLVISSTDEKYFEKLIKFTEKRKINSNICINTEHDGISKERNSELYDMLSEKLSKKPFSLMPNCQYETLVKGREKFGKLSVEEQVYAVLNVLSLFKTGRTSGVDMTAIGGVKTGGVTAMSSKLSNWAKAYSDVRIIDYSPSGIFKKQSKNLLELL